MATPALQPAPAPAAAPAPVRLAHLANVRSLVMLLVLGTHSAVTYSGMGRWYRVEGRPDLLDPVSRALFGLQLTFMQAWFMGILFFLAAAFAARSLSSRGARAFVRERLLRLGAPLLLYVFVMEPLIAWWFVENGRWHRELSLPRLWAGYVGGGRFVSGTGPLWFAEALLGFCLLYAAFRAVRPSKGGPARPPEAAAPRTRTLLLLVALIGAAAFAIRLVMPMGTAVGNLQLPFFASYVVLFALGIHAGETGWLTQLPEAQGLRWFRAALWGGIPAWLVLMVLGSARTGRIPIEGGLHWQALAYAFWEAFVAVAMSIGLLAFARRSLAADTRLTRWLADTSFGVYFLHPPVLIGITVLLAPVAWPMLAKHAAVWPLAYLASLAAAEVARRVPGLNAVIR
jgi:peptidoglycan/LPS O-acetylase OafA/YrhL